MFVNIFGGITRCDWSRRACSRRSARIQATVPIVVRLDGTNAEEGRRILADAAHPRIVPVGHHVGGRRSGRRRARERGGRMSVLVGADTRLVVVQGVTGKEGTFHTLRNRAYGTTRSSRASRRARRGQDVEGIPVFDTVAEAVAASKARTPR